ncbi:hypothetical protein LA080_011336 [Diaporthe eres]|nr:hypothetical protein LA080_011336 [Diaporthe eres]
MPPVPKVFVDTLRLRYPHTASTDQNRKRRSRCMGPATWDPVLGEPRDPVRNRNNPLPQAGTDTYIPLSLPPVPPIDSEDSDYSDTFGSTTGNLYSSHPRSAPTPADRTQRTDRPDGLGTKIRPGTQCLPTFVSEPELRGETPRYADDHGSHRKTATDVKPVNADLDASKAKKPLKMLVTSYIRVYSESEICHIGNVKQSLTSDLIQMIVQSQMEPRAEDTALQSNNKHSMVIEKIGENDSIPAQSPPLAQVALMMSSKVRSAENALKASLESIGTAIVPTNASSPLIVLRSQGDTIMGKDVEKMRDDGKRLEQRYEGALDREQRGKALRIFGSCSDCRRRRVSCQPAHHNITWEDLDRWWSSHSNIRSSPAAAGQFEQQNHEPFQEGTVADSGYVSACASGPCHESKPHDELIDRGIIAQPEQHNRQAGDQHTVYTSQALPQGSDYITDLCNDIHRRLKHDLLEHTPDQAWRELPKCLPDLIKALAIQIGLDRSNSASPYVMHFLHTHSKDIVSQLGALCRNREESPEVSHRRPSEEDGMGVLDKMKLWHRKENEQSPLEPDQDDLFKGVRDEEEEDIAGNAEMAMHRDYVLSSTAYKWFIASLRKQLSLDWGLHSHNVTGSDSCGQIHQSIMSKMSSGIISKHRPPEIHHARFHINIRPDAFHCLQGGLAANLMVFTSSAPNIVQASTLQGYLDRTWPSGGVSLVKLLQRQHNDRSTAEKAGSFKINPSAGHGFWSCVLDLSMCLSVNKYNFPRCDGPLQTDMSAWGSRHIIANPEHFGLPVVDSVSSFGNNMGEVCAQAEAQRVEMRENLDPAPSPREKGSSSMASPGDSLDSDMMSISSGNSDCAPSLDPEDPLALIVDVISRRLFNEYKGSGRFISKPQSGRKRNGTPAGDSGNSSVSCATSKSQVRGTSKRGRPDGEYEDWDDGGFRKPPPPTKRRTLPVSPSRPRRRTLACPFWKLDSQAHRPCFNRKFSRISDVKLHLYRKHKQPASDYCQRCWTAYESRAHKEEHLQDPLGQACQYNPSARPVGIDNNMAAALHKKSNPSLSTEDQWFAVWDIVFPDEPRPSSPYINDNLSEDATQLQEIIINQWPSILASIAEEAGRSNTSVDTDRLEHEHLIRATLNRLLDAFSAEQETMRTAESASNYQSPGGRTASSSNRADSAIELESYQMGSHSSSNSGDETALLTAGTVGRQHEAYNQPVPDHSSVVYGRRERPILPAGPNTVSMNHNRQEMQGLPPSIQSTGRHIMPTPPTRQMPSIPDLTNMHTMDTYGADDTFGSELAALNGPTPSVTNDDWFQASQGNGEFNGDISWEGMEIPTVFDWSMFEMEKNNGQAQPDTWGGE